MVAAIVFLVTALTACNGEGDSGAVETSSEVSFNRDIRPILNTNCIACHGGVRKEGGLSFIYREEALGMGESGRPAIVAGDPLASEFIARITHENPNERMPFDRPPLTDTEIDLLTSWIEQGAVWEEHWSFVPVQAPELPPTPVAGSQRSITDYFVQSRLQKEGLQFSMPASKSELLRRASLDLTGLPPTLEDIGTFQADASDNAYEKQIDRLLSSPHFGERWASTWLDLARYADTKGYEQDRRRTVWPYRDWVIDAYNENMPYDEFVIKQLAADLMPEADFSDQIATTFHRLTQSNDESGTEDEEFRMLAAMDRSTTTWSVVNGLTMECVQCHAHPYDPIRHDEYYKSLAFFNTSRDADWMRDDYPYLFIAKNPEQVDAVFKLQQRVRDLSSSLVRQGRQILKNTSWMPLPITSAFYDPLNGLERRIARIDAQKEEDSDPGKMELADSLAAAKALEDATVRFPVVDGEARAEGEVPNIAIAVLNGDSQQTTLTALRIEVPPLHSDVARHTPENGFIVEQVDAWIVGPDGQRERIPFSYFVPDSEENTNFVQGTTLWRNRALTGLEKTQPDPRDLHAKTGAFAAKTHQFYTRWTVGIVNSPVAVPAGSTIEVQLPYGEYYGLGVTPAPVRHVRLSTSDDPAWLQYSRDPKRRKQVIQLARAFTRLAKSPTFSVPVIREQEASFARETRLFQRGNPLEKTGKALVPSAPAFLPAFEGGEQPTRLDLAKWLFAPEQPLTARVAVNRFWQQLFGIGLVETLEDFGSVGSAPSHPALLDGLAWRFQNELQWDVKAFLKEVVLSETYRQSAKATAEMIERDPYNRLLARGPEKRLSAEMVRDQALLASGLLTQTVGGRTVMPPQPAGVSNAVHSFFAWHDSVGEDRYRRAIYTFLKRSAIYPSMASFDAPSRLVTHARRMPTNTPLQALVTLNDPVYVEAAQALADELIESPGDLEAQVSDIALRILSRPFSDAEKIEVLSLYEHLNEMNDGDERSSLAIVVGTVLNMDAAFVR